MWVIGLLKTRPFMERGGRDLLQVRNSVQEADAAVDQHALEAEAKPVQARQPLRGVAGRQAPPGRAAGAAADGGAVQEGQPIPPFFSFFGRTQKRCHSAPKMVKRDTGPFFCRFCSTSKAVSRCIKK